MSTQRITKIMVHNINAYEHFLAQDVYTKMGVLIAKKDSVIGTKILNKFKIYGIDSVNIYVKTNTSADAYQTPSVIPGKDAKVVQEFKENYMFTADKLKNNFSEISEGKEIDTEQIKKTGSDIINILKYDTDIFSYLSTMKNTDDTTFSHCLNVSILCQLFGKWLNLDEHSIELLSTAGLLHDIGKTKIDPDILNKRGPLTLEETEHMRNHVIFSYKIIENHDIDSTVKQAVLMHHERIDGSGYVTGATDKSIPKFAKIVAIVDTYDAMTQQRPYRNKMLPLKVLEYLKNNSINKFDYALTNTFIDFASRSYKGNWARLATGEQGEIVFINPENISRPIIKIDNDIVDLNKYKELSIAEIL